MFVYTVRASTLKFIAVITASAAAIVSLVLFLPKYDFSAETSAPAVIERKIRGEDGVKEFLSQYGWEATELVDRAEVTVPSQFDAVYEEYNTLQKKQGFDLSKYRRKTVKRYTYLIDS